MINDSNHDPIKMNQTNKLFKYLIGSCAGIMEHLTLYPVDTLKVGISKHVVTLNSIL